MSLGDQACGIEQELIELVSRRERALAQGRQEELAQLDAGIRALQDQLAALAELAGRDGDPRDERPVSEFSL